ncbi:MAG TPA: helix-turn-helix transcriptional regulator [Cytophagales bacterium]|nr:helix-turn-helix transcriptional regulator [Cytophagales bacterium]
MKYQMFDPPAFLKDFVRFFWVLEGDSVNESYIYRSLADGCSELIFHYKGTFEELTDKENIKQSYSLIHAQSQNFKRFITFENFAIFGVYLYPFAIPQLFSLPSTELSNQLVDLQTLLGNEGGELEEKMMLAGDNLERVKILSSFLENRVKKIKREEPGVFAAINHIINSGGTLSVEKLSDNFCLSTRQFERKFKEYAGFSPKLYSRIIRFQTALKDYGNYKKPLTQIAFDCGYYDQSHFIHDFKEFSGYHPKAYFSGNAEGSEYREV